MTRLILAYVFFVCSVALSQIAYTTSVFGECFSGGCISGQFVQTGAGITTDSLVYPDPFDTWEFRTTGTAPIEAIELDFAGDFIQSVGSIDFLEGTALPIVFGFTAPETFFSTRVGDGGDVLAAPGTTIDTVTQLASAYTIAGKFIDDGVGITTTIAVFSVPAGALPPILVSSSPFINIVPEPAALVLTGFGFVVICLRRRSC